MVAPSVTHELTMSELTIGDVVKMKSEHHMKNTYYLIGNANQSGGECNCCHMGVNYELIGNILTVL